MYFFNEIRSLKLLYRSLFLGSGSLFIGALLFFSAFSAHSQEPLPAAIRFATPTASLAPDKTPAKTSVPSTTPEQPTIQNIIKNFSPAQQAQIQKIAEQIAGKMKKKHGDDPDKIQSELQHYMANPSEFYQELSPEQKSQVNSMGKEVIKKE